MENIPKLNIVQ